MRYLALITSVFGVVAALPAQTLFVPNGATGVAAVGNGTANVGIGTMSPTRLLSLNGASNAFLGFKVGDVLQSTIGNDGAATFFVFDDRASAYRLVINPSGNVGIGTRNPATPLHVIGPITAGYNDSTWGEDYLYGAYPNGKLFVLGSLYSSAASFLGFAVKANNLAPGYVSSTGVSTSRSSIEANMGYVAFLTGPTQTSTDGGPISLTERMRVDVNGNVGIGTSTPGTKLEVNGDAALKSSGHAYFYISGAAGDSEVLWQEGQTNRWALGMNVGDATENFNLYNYTTGTTSLSVNRSSGNVGIGTTNPTQKLSVNGTVQAKEVIVQTGWSDYVFDSDYRLAPLSELERHIKADKHLPGIPSAKQVAEQGISLGDMQAKLLAKLEEVTLHLIAQEKKIEQLQAENAALRSEVREIKQAR